jgi:hypothetical protein
VPPEEGELFVLVPPDRREEALLVLLPPLVRLLLPVAIQELAKEAAKGTEEETSRASAQDGPADAQGS